MDQTARQPSSAASATFTIGSIVACPEVTCEHVAEIVDRWAWPSTSGPVAHVRTRCLGRHVFTVPLDTIVPVGRVAGVTPAGRGASRVGVR